MLSTTPFSPPSASSFAPEHDLIFYALLALTILFTGIVFVGVVFFTIRYRKGTKYDRSRPIYEDLRLELTWTIIPLILGVIMFFFGAHLFIKQRNPPPDAQEIFVMGKQWMWHIQHSNGVRENNTLHVPVGKDIKLTMISQDVIHAFYIPAFRTQFMVVPGRYTQMWFRPTKVGEYHLFCNMYCGTQHSEMGGKVVVMEQKDWANWIANGGNSVPPMTMQQAGERLFNKLACTNCHGAEDNLRAPSLYGIYGTKRMLADGTSAVADDTYLRESILRPHNRLTSGYGPTMPAYDTQISEADVLNLISYVKSMGTPGAKVTSSLMSPTNVPTQSSRISPTPMSTNAIQYNAESTDATPTNRNNGLSVNAIAAQEAAEGRQ